jgi:hypothetical protein
MSDVTELLDAAAAGDRQAAAELLPLVYDEWHFFAAAEAMRRILIESARRKQRSLISLRRTHRPRPAAAMALGRG